MSRFRTYAEIFDGKLPEDFGVSVVKGTSLTIPGQGSDLAQVIASIVKLPPMDARDYDMPAGQEVDIRSLAVKTELDAMYLAEGRNLAEDAKVRQNERKQAKKANDAEKDEGVSTENADKE